MTINGGRAVIHLPADEYAAPAAYIYRWKSSNAVRSRCSPKSVVVLRFRRFCGFPTAPVIESDALYLLARRERGVDALSGACRAPIGCSLTAAAAIETSDDLTTRTSEQRLLRWERKWKEPFYFLAYSLLAAMQKGVTGSKNAFTTTRFTIEDEHLMKRLWMSKKCSDVFNFADLCNWLGSVWSTWFVFSVKCLTH